MPKDFNLGLVFLSYLVAVTASHVTLLLAARVRDPHATNWKLWVVCGGFAMGIDRFIALLAREPDIRQVTAFPKIASGNDPLTGAPTPYPDSALRELGIRLLDPQPE